MSSYNNSALFYRKILIIRTSEDPEQNDPVSIVAKCYREVIDKRCDTNIEHTQQSLEEDDRATKRSKVEVSKEDEALDSSTLKVRMNAPISRSTAFVDTPEGCENNQIVTRKTVQQGDQSIRTIDVKLVFTGHNCASSLVKERRLEHGPIFIPMCTKMFKDLYEEIIEYLTHDEADAFLVKVIIAIYLKFGRGTIYTTTAVNTLMELYDKLNLTDLKAQLEYEYDTYLRRRTVEEVMAEYRTMKKISTPVNI